MKIEALLFFGKERPNRRRRPAGPGRVADWKRVGVEGLRDMAAGQSPQVEHIADIEAWNQVHYEARRDQPWDGVWADLHAAREALLEVLEGMGQADPTRSFRFPWGPQGTVCESVYVYPVHGRGHARDLMGVATASPRGHRWQSGRWLR
jgi:hypothetical protein